MDTTAPSPYIAPSGDPYQKIYDDAALGNLLNPSTTASEAHRNGIDAVVRAVRADAVEAFAAAYSRSNEIIDRDIVEEILAEIADKAGCTFRQFHDAMLAGDERTLPYPVAALTHLLAVVAGASAAFGFDPTLTGTEIVDQIRAADVTTPACDVLRLHLLAVHGNLAALNHTDREARADHAHEHNGPGGIRNHDQNLLDWSEQQILRQLSYVPLDEGRDEMQHAANQVVERVRAASRDRVSIDG